MAKKKELTQAQRQALHLKMEVAEELGLMEKVEKVGFSGLTSRESGQIGGMISKRKRQEAKKAVSPCNQHQKEI